ncbi:unnamed protein product [Rhizophagus irregularis]|uniref:Uncharacterized protein n=1 Tax=Rhizophagus irregularis TaxID=588596 RepID=A0A915Z582_9GLOM|nr:unnamed protein product [Rhizophagus irregularis]
MIEEANPELIGFFSSMVNAIIPKDRLAYNKQEAKKSVVALCYMIAGLRNKFVNQFKIEVGLYLAASGVMWEAIDTLSRDCLHIYNINDYHNIHEKRRPDTTSTSVVKHFTTCVAKPITECPTVLVVFNGISVHNPNNVEALRICCYDDTIAERKHKRSMSGLQLIGFKEQHLHSMQDYLNALKMILAVNKNSKCLEGHVAPIVADWPANHDPIFKDVYCKTYRYLYSSSTLDFLSNKTSLFLLEHFCSIFHNQNNSIPVYSGGKKKKLKGYKLATLGKEVDLCHLPTAYTLACGHGYYPSCYGRRCIYCENFYKNGIFENVNSFLKKIEKGKDTLTQNNLNDENNEEEKEESSEEPVNEQAVVSAMLEAAINNINYW